MRIALVQVHIEGSGRSANLSRVLDRLIHVAKMVPAPDLVMLPAGCDGLDHNGVTRAMIQGFSESLAALAREWGLFVAGAFLQDVGGDRFQQARLYDPDGDVMGRSARGPGSSVGEAIETPLGRIVLALDDDDRPVEVPGEKSDMILVHGRWTAPGGRLQFACNQIKNRMAKLAAASNSVVCSVGSVGQASSSTSSVSIGGGMVHAASGANLMSMVPGVEAVEVVELNSAPASPPG